MKIAVMFFIASVADPIRWVVSIFAAWLMKSHLGAVALSVVLATGLTFVVGMRPVPGYLIIGGIVSAAITSAFFLLRRKINSNKERRAASESIS